MRLAGPIGRALLIVVVLASAAGAAEPRFPALTGRVVDQANVLSAATRDRLTQMLAAHEQATRQQVVVVTVPSLQGLAIEDFGYRLGRAWGIGEKGRDTGALLIVAPSDRQVRIEVGYGLEDRLTDAMSRAIIEREILPAFRRGELDAGITAGAAAMVRVLGGAPGSVLPGNPVAADEGEDLFTALIVLLVVGFIVFQFFGRRRRGFFVGAPMGGVWSAGGRSRDDRGGGFSGGGGSFGGGGASGRW